MNPYHCTIIGEPASKANSRKVVLIKGKIRVIKSNKARNYLRLFEQQARVRDPLFEEDVAVGMHIVYKSRRPDLDESLILDALQGYAYKNDRSVKIKLITWGLNRDQASAEIMVVPVGEHQMLVDHFLP